MDSPVRYPGMRWLVFVAAGLGMLAANMYLVSFAPILPQIADSLGVPVATATNFMSLYMLFASVSMICGGFFADRFGALPVLFAATLIAAVGSVTLPWTGHTYKMALMSRCLQGIGTGLVFSLLVSVVGVWFPPKERGLVSGLLGTFILLGAVVGFPLSAALFEATKSWQQMSAFLSIAGWIPCAITLGILLAPKPQLPSQSGAHAAPPGGNRFLKAFTEPTTWVVLGLLFCAAWLLQTIFNVTPTYLAAAEPMGIGFGHVTASKLMLAVSVAGVLAPIISGIIQDKVFGTNARPFVFIGYALCAICMFLLLQPMVYKSGALLLITLILAGSGISILLPAIIVFIANSYEPDISGKIFGVCNGIGNFGGALGLFVAGATVAATGNYTMAIICISLAGVLGFILTMLLRNRKQAGTQTA